MGCHVRLNKGTAATVTVPPHSTGSFPKGFHCQIEQRGAGQITISPGSGVNIRSLNSATKTSGQYAVCRLDCVDNTGNE
jgi:hypothetical protein